MSGLLDRAQELLVGVQRNGSRNFIEDDLMNAVWAILEHLRALDSAQATTGPEPEDGSSSSPPQGPGQSRAPEIERVAKRLHQLYGPSEVQAWGDQNFDHDPWLEDAQLILDAKEAS